jgi:Na+-transporting NADH:ubiquinone oxidoreductase subunit NqrC
MSGDDSGPRQAAGNRNSMFGKILIILALLVVAGTLVAGIAVMAIGGKTDAKWSNVLMRYRVLAQAIAVAILLAVLYFNSH